MDEDQISSYLELLDLPDSFTEAQLKQAYHDLVQVWHPDKHSHNERLRKKAEEKMKEINHAYEVLQSSVVDGRFSFARSGGKAGSPTSRNGPTSHHQPSPDLHTRRTEPPPHNAAPAVTARDEPTRLSGNAVWILLIGLVLLIVMVVSRGRNAAPPEMPQVGTPSNDAEPPLLVTIEGPLAGSNTAHLPICQALDSKYGFKDLKFGMLIDEASRRWKPDRVTTNQYDDVATLWYGPGADNRLGDLPLDDVNAFFFRGRLFKIEVSFSSNQEQIFETLQRSFGASVPNDSLSRGSASLRAECWFGEKVFCAIVAPRNSDRDTGWDAMVMSEQALQREAKQYARTEPIRVARVLSESGFGEFKFGMTLKDFGRKLRQPPSISGAGLGQKEAVIAGSRDTRLGRYPLISLRASFFQDRLYRIEMDFELNRQALYEGFLSRFPSAVDSDSWSRNGRSIQAKQFTGQKAVAAILAPRPGSTQWDSIVLYDRHIDERRREFERDAPKRAAQDL